jgi:hypothetical protein
MFEPDKQVVNPDVVRVWSARTLLGRLRNNKERVDNVENSRNIMSRATGALEKKFECLPQRMVYMHADCDLYILSTATFP